ncbi:MAG TPA: hypothetical protein VHD81_07050 [Mycobacteriales bacterium]|nr:hypothetical protein [Mycobacteriales bacterium]
MALAAYFHPEGMTLAQFSEIHAKLEAAGEGKNSHRLHHSCFGTDGDLMIYDIWDSEDAFQAFGAKLMPMLAEMGITVEPHVMPLHKLLQYDADQ